MASSSDMLGDALTAAHEEPHGETASAVLSDAPNGDEDSVLSDAPRGGEDSVPEPPRLPDICNLDWQREGMPDTEFNRKYPPDAWGEEAAPNARVWKIYRDQQTVSDRGMLESWNKTLDVLLIFAGLFSAVSTAFLIESYKTLQPDYTQYVAVFLYAAAVSHDRTGGAFPSLDTIAAPDRFVQTSATQRWTNGLWFSSLVISLGVALLCILIKQWLDEYDAHVSSATHSPKYWARRHRMYHRGLQTWGVPGLISFLPVLLHLSLFLFFGGLVLFLLPLDGTIAYSTLVLVSCILTFYSLSLVLPAWRVECPSYTPLFAQVLTTVSRGLSCIIYLVCILEGRLHKARYAPVRSRFHPVIRALHTKVARVGSRLRSIGTGWHLLREKECIAKWDEELDGHILSAILLLPSDLTWGIVHSACAAIGAVPSARTTAILNGNVQRRILNEKFEDSYEKITSRGAGFGITTHAQLRRAERVLEVQSNPRRSCSLKDAPGLRSSLGIDGLLLQAMGVEDADGHIYDVDVLLRSLQLCLVSGGRSHGFPLRSTCLLFLDTGASPPGDFSLIGVPSRDSLSFLSCVLLVLCAGRFESADRKDRFHALQSLEVVIRRDFSIPLPAHNGSRDLVLAVANGLWMILADPEKYRIDPVTARIVAQEAMKIYSSEVSSEDPWAQLLGLSTFIRSPFFGQCVPTRDAVLDYLSPFYFPNLAKCTQAQVFEFWECSAALYKLDWEYISLSEEPFYDLSTNLFPVEPRDWNLIKELSNLGPYETQDDWFEPALAAFLDGPNAIATWTGAASLHLDINHTVDIAVIALHISMVLCRRQHLGRANDSFVPGFFAGSFLFARFRDLVLRDIPNRSGCASFEKIVLGLARHCLRLSPAGCLEICAQLEQLEVPDADAHEYAVSLAEYIRDGTRPGGALSEACPAKCPCMIELARPARGLGGVWNGLVTRFRRGRTGPVTAEDV